MTTTPAGALRETYERIGLAASVDRVSISGGDGDDAFHLDDTSAELTIDGGNGADRFQIGQLFGANRTIRPSRPATRCAWCRPPAAS
jgi:hypothetical protein